MIVLLGSSGYVGSAFQSELRRRGWEYRTVSITEAGINRREVLHDALKSLRPKFLVNCAGYTGKPNVDKAEEEKFQCLEANTWLPGMIAEVCEQEQLPWGHVSSGCIYTGRREDGLGFRENDPANFDFRHNNCSFYSGTKALAEEILADYENVYLWRLRIPFTHLDSPRNYLSKLMQYERLLNVENSLSNLEEFVRGCLDLWQQRALFGVYNMTNPGIVSTEEVAELIQRSGVISREWEFFKSEEDFMEKAAIAPRSSCVLDVSKALSAGAVLSEVHESIESCLKNWKWR